MNISYNWLSEFCECPDVETLVKDFNRIGFEVESVQEKGGELSNIYVGKITSFEPHPDADRLRIAQVDIGTETTQIVTAAANVSEGDVIPVSLPGATLASGLKIKKSKLRGVESNGMMCSAVECGLIDEADGVWVLPKNTPIGEDFISLAQLKDTILDVAVLPNRGDCLSVFGLARECVALYGKAPLSTKATIRSVSSKQSKEIKINVDESLCSYYQVTKISGINTEIETPVAMQTRLYYAGMRPISWIVDVTNYAMLEYGQPLHAFDARDLDHISVEVGESESVELLNQKTINMKGLPIIKVNQSIGAVAGVMGSIGSEVCSETSDIVLESAIFDPVITRKASKVSGIRSESSNRFEKGVDQVHLKLAVQRVIELIETSNGQAIEVFQPSVFDKTASTDRIISINIDQINSLLGTDYTINNIESRLTLLGFKCNGSNIEVPDWRLNDCRSWPDIAEELIRFDGLLSIESRPIERMVQISHDHLYKCQQDVRKICISSGFTEIIPFPLLSEDIQESQPVISNPISDELSTLRSNGIQSILECFKFNSARHSGKIQIFSIGPVWSNSGDESLHLTILLQGPKQYMPYNTSEYHKNAYDYYDAKGIVERVIGSVDYSLERSNNEWLHPGQSADISINDDFLGSFGVLHPEYQEQYKCGDAIIIELDISKLSGISTGISSYKPVSKFPSTTRDVTYIMDENVSVGDVITILKKQRPTLCQAIHCCGYYQPDQTNEVNVSFRMVYQADDSSCDTEMVNNIHKTFAESVINDLPCRFP